MDPSLGQRIRRKSSAGVQSSAGVSLQPVQKAEAEATRVAGQLQEGRRACHAGHARWAFPGLSGSSRLRPSRALLMPLAAWIPGEPPGGSFLGPVRDRAGTPRGGNGGHRLARVAGAERGRTRVADPRRPASVPGVGLPIRYGRAAACSTTRRKGAGVGALVVRCDLCLLGSLEARCCVLPRAGWKLPECGVRPLWPRLRPLASRLARLGRSWRCRAGRSSRWPSCLGIPSTRPLGRVGAVLLHAALLLILGPWGMGQSAIVLVWNAAMAVEVWLAFGPDLGSHPERRSRAPESAWGWLGAGSRIRDGDPPASGSRLWLL